MSTARKKWNAAESAGNLRVVQVRPQGIGEMRPVDRGRQAPDQELRKGRVAGCVGQAWSVEFPEAGLTVTAKRAAGCLLLPQVGDVVLTLFDGVDGEHYLLSVLERESTDRALDFPGDAQILAEQGALRLQSEALDMEAAESARLAGKAMSLEAVHGRMRFVRLDLLAEALDAGVHRAKAVGERMQIVASHLASRLGRAIRSTGFELHRAGRVRTEVEAGYALKAGRASIKAKKDVAIDGDEINLG